MIKKLTVAIIPFIAALSPVFAWGSVAHAETAKEAAQKGAGVVDPSTTTTVDSALTTGINLFSLLVGVIAVIMVIYGGLRYIMATGDASKINTAKNTILYAMIGLGIAAAAQVLVRFVLHQTT